MIHILSSSPLSDLERPGISWTATKKLETSPYGSENDKEESWEIGDSKFGVEGSFFAVIFEGIGTASVGGAL